MKELINAFQELAKINKIELVKKGNMNPLELVYNQEQIIVSMAKNWDLKKMINFSLTSKRNREIMEPLINERKRELQFTADWLKNNSYHNYDIKYLDQLEEIELNNLNLTELPENLFQGLKNLGEVFFNYNQLTSLPENLFKGLNIYRLDFSNNRLTSVPNFDLPELEELYLANNLLTSVPNFNFPNLIILDLSDNNLRNIPGFNLPNLKELWLVENILPKEEKERLQEKYEDIEILRM